MLREECTGSYRWRRKGSCSAMEGVGRASLFLLYLFAAGVHAGGASAGNGRLCVFVFFSCCVYASLFSVGVLCFFLDVGFREQLEFGARMLLRTHCTPCAGLVYWLLSSPVVPLVAKFVRKSPSKLAKKPNEKSQNEKVEGHSSTLCGHDVFVEDVPRRVSKKTTRSTTTMPTTIPQNSFLFLSIFLRALIRPLDS